MKILVINTGSSSIKYELFDMAGEERLASGVAERIGEKKGYYLHRGTTPGGRRIESSIEMEIGDHEDGLGHILEMLLDSETGVIRDKKEISAVGHRVVHGGEAFHSTTVIDEGVLAAIGENIPLAPLHNPANLMGIKVAMTLFPDSPQVAVFDTAFHQTLPKRAYLYAIPYDLYEKTRVRRYGFHGTSHAYVAERAANIMGRPLEELNLITLHLGNGASMAAIRKGRSMDTSMGMTPLGGLVMGTRSGDVDPALPFFLADHLGMSLKEIDGTLNRESGLKGMCGYNDMREVIERAEVGDDRAKTALEVYTYRVKKYIGAYFAALGSVDGIVFTAGIGENSAYIRGQCCKGLESLGIEVDPDRNKQPFDHTGEISRPQSGVKILVIPTNEELRIAQETQKVILS
jgi:acetate kinase